MTLRVLLADDQALLRTSFRLLVDSEPGMQVVGEATNGHEAVDLALRERPDVVLMDIRMPELDGIEATRRIVADPSMSEVRILILTTFEVEDLVVQALRAGASGFLGKGVDAGALLHGIRTVFAGEALLSSSATRALVARVVSQPSTGRDPSTALIQDLTPREREIVQLVGLGLSNDDIADRLVISPATAKTHVNRAMTKLGARDRAQLVITAYEAGLVIPGQKPG